MSSVEPQDATMYWLSRRTRNDLFLVYCFAESELSTDELRAGIEHRSAGIPDLRVRLRPAPGDLAYPAWVPCGFDSEQFVEHPLPQADWPHLEEALGELLAMGVDATAHPWRMHIFRGITGAPLPGGVSDDNEPPGVAASARAERRRDGRSGTHDSSGRSEPAILQQVTVAVLQMSHALADGKRAADLARALFAPSAVSRADSRPRAGQPVSSDEQVLQGAVESPVVVGLMERGGPTGSSGELVGIPATVQEHAGVADEQRPARDGDRIGVRTGSVDSAERSRLVPRAASSVTDLMRSGTDTVRLGMAAVGIPVRMVRTVVGGIRAYRAQRELGELTAAGELPEPGGGFAPGVLNGPGEVGGHRVRMIVCPARQLRVPGFSVTVVALTAVSIALERYLQGRGDPVDRLGAQVPMALTEPSPARNNYRSLGVDLSAGEPNPRRRAERIAADLAARRTRAAHPLLSVQDRVTAGLPAPILRRDVDRYPIGTVPDALAGHTVVSSVHRGAADLVFGSAPVLFTAGFPALGAVMHLTHGLHGLGDSVTISLHADPGNVPDLDSYADMVRDALEGVGGAIRASHFPAIDRLRGRSKNC